MRSCIQTSAHLTVAAEIFYSDLILNPTIHVKHIETSSICSEKESSELFPLNYYNEFHLLI